MQGTDRFLGQHARLQMAEQHLRQNGELAHAIAKDMAARLKRVALALPNKPEVYLKDRNSEQEYDVRYHVGVARTFRSGLFRSFRYKLLQVHLHGNFKTVVARITAPEGHAFESGIPLKTREQAAEIFSTEYLASVLQGQISASDEAGFSWRAETRSLGLLGRRF